MFKPTVNAAIIASVVLISAMSADIALDGVLVISPAQAVIGRPVTPMSYAGVARRTTRRAIYATSVYAATLPRGCTTVVIEGTALYRCGPTYHQATGGRYVVVKVD